jgi:hypothetical protein
MSPAIQERRVDNAPPLLEADSRAGTGAKACVLFALLFGLSIPPVVAEGTRAGCEAILLSQNSYPLKSKSAARSYWLKALDRSNYDAMRSDASLDVPGYFTGNWNSDRQKFSKESELETQITQKDQALSADTQLVRSRERADSWLDRAQ